MSQPDPDQLLKSLDVALAQARAKHARSGGNRNAVRLLSITILVIGTIAALAALQYLASDLAERRPAAKPNKEAAGPK